MNSFLKKAVATAAAALMTVSGMGISAFAEGVQKLTVTEFAVDYAASVAKPTYSVKGSKGVRYIKLTTTTKNAKIYYTTDGTTPTTKSKSIASGKLLSISKKTQIKAIAVLNGTKSAVMTKTFNVATMVGDVTGDGKINSTDYTRLENYLAGKTTYICKDNADTSGNGSIAKKDLTLLRQYLNGEIKKFPNAASSSKVTAPTVTVYKTYGGKNIELKVSDSKAKIYYTTNGKTPTKDSNLYSKKFLVTKDCTVKYVAYKDGNYSEVKSKDVEVPACKAVVADKSTTTEYDEQVIVKLSTATTDSSVRIYYTLDGTNPVSSNTAMLYKSALTLKKNTTVKAYATAKGYADSAIATFNYKVKESGFTISGSVWNDTPSDTTVADGIRRSGDTGVNGIKVYLLNVDTNRYEDSATTTTINGVVGSYEFNGAKKGNKYKVVFEFNGQMYRTYDYVVSNGNQALCSTPPAWTIKYEGAYDSSNKLIASGVNSYSKASTSSAFNTTASTNSYYMSEAKEVNLALVTNHVGKLSLAMVPTKVNNVAYTTSTKVVGGDTVQYTITLNNQSAKASVAKAGLRIFISDKYNKDSVKVNDNAGNVKFLSTSAGYHAFEVSDSVFGSVTAGKTSSITLSAIVSSSVTASSTLSASAEILSYRLDNSAFDKTSTPGNMTVGTPKESDEVKASDIKANDGGKTIDCVEKNQTITLQRGETKSLTVYVKNPTKPNKTEEIEVSSSSNAITYNVIGASNYSADTIKIQVDVTGSTEIDNVRLNISLKDDGTQYVVVNFKVVKPEVKMEYVNNQSTVTINSDKRVNVSFYLKNAGSNPTISFTPYSDKITATLVSKTDTSSDTILYVYQIDQSELVTFPQTAIKFSCEDKSIEFTINLAQQTTP